MFGFWKFWNSIQNQNAYFWEVCFLKLFDLKPPNTILGFFFYFFLTLGGLFWEIFLVFEYFEIVIIIRMSTFGGSVFLNFLIWSLLGIFETLRGLVVLLANDPILLSTPRWSFRHLQLQNMFIISDFTDWARWCNNSRVGALRAGGERVQLS